MTGQELKDFVESLIDDSIEETLFYTLLAVAKDEIEDDREWEVLKDWNRTLTLDSSDTYLTAKSLPTDFRSMYGEGVIYIGEDNPYLPVPFKDIYRYRNLASHYAIDYANNKIYILGSESSALTINLPYLKTSDDILPTTSWSFPARYHKILGFLVAGYYTAGVDADDIYARMSPEHKIAAMTLRQGLNKWNTRLALMAMGNSTTPPLVSSGGQDGHLSAADKD